MTKKLIKITAFLLALSFGGLAVYYYLPQSQESAAEQIVEFNEKRDTQEILDIFKSDKYWLLSSPNYSPEYMLQTRSPNKEETRYLGQLSIKVLRKGGAFIGFVAYYMRNFFMGTVLFLDIKPEFRGKGYAQELMRYAIADLKKQGASMITLVTRSANHAAQAVYKKMGFTVSHEEEGYVYFEMRLN